MLNLTRSAPPTLNRRTWPLRTPNEFAVVSVRRPYRYHPPLSSARGVVSIVSRYVVRLGCLLWLYPQTWQPAELLALNLESLRCQVCSRGDDDEQLLLCDGCDRGFHTYCVEMDDIPQGEWYCPDCEQQRALLAATARGRRLGGARGGGRGRGVAAAAAATGSGRGWAARGRGRNGAATAAAAMAEESSSDSDSYGEVSGDAAAEAAAVAGHGGGRGGGSDVSGYDTIGSDAEDQEGPDVGWVGGSDDGEGGAEVDYDHDDTNEDGIGSGGQDDEDQEEDAGEQGGVYGPTAGSRGGGGARRRARSRSAGRGRSRGRGRGRRRQTSAARGRRRTGSRRGPTRAALRERLGTAAQSRARTAAQGPGSAAAAAAAAAAAGDLEEVPLAQRRTVARARLYADQLRVEMMRRNWESLRDAETMDFGQSTLGAEYRRSQQEQAAAAAAGGAGGSTSAAAAARERALQALRAQRAQEAAAAAAAARSSGRRGGVSESIARSMAFGTGAYGTASAASGHGGGGADDELAGAWQALDRLRGAASAGGAARGGTAPHAGGASGSGLSGSGGGGRSVPARLGGPPVGSSPLELLRSAGPGALVGGFSRPQRPPATAPLPTSSGAAAAVAAPSAAAVAAVRASRGDANQTAGCPLSATVRGLTNWASATAAPSSGRSREGLAGTGSSHDGRRDDVVTARVGPNSSASGSSGVSGRAVGGTAASRGIVTFPPEGSRESGIETAPRPHPHPYAHTQPSRPPQQSFDRELGLSSHGSPASEPGHAAFFSNAIEVQHEGASPTGPEPRRPHVVTAPAPAAVFPVRVPDAVLPSLVAHLPPRLPLTTHPSPLQPPPLPLPPRQRPLPPLSRQAVPTELLPQPPEPTQIQGQYPPSQPSTYLPSCSSHELESGEIQPSPLDSHPQLQPQSQPLEAVVSGAPKENQGGCSGGPAAAGEAAGASDGDGRKASRHRHHQHSRQHHRHGDGDMMTHQRHPQGREHHHRDQYRRKDQDHIRVDTAGHEQQDQHHHRDRHHRHRRCRHRAVEEAGSGSEGGGAAVTYGGPHLDDASGSSVRHGGSVEAGHDTRAQKAAKAAKVAACEAIKALLAPLYAQQLLRKEEFKDAARVATAALCADMAAAGMSSEDLRRVTAARGSSGGDQAAGSELAKAALGRTLQGMGLDHLIVG
ncbi:hypothetical protein Vafri_15786 [Volvox africanus]|uniref:PHD-type domain-containing protein n=1 Tax=Volvox africanus TaxID=51714 RepID=A0A8J4BG18_9CHLO|nr:hypothetical protein Vafri_15786 [Volvox africanus]